MEVSKNGATLPKSMAFYFRLVHGQPAIGAPFWANYNNSLTWIKAIKGDDFPNPNHDFQGSLVVSSLFHLPRPFNIIPSFEVASKVQAPHGTLFQVGVSEAGAGGSFVLVGVASKRTTRRGRVAHGRTHLYDDLIGG